MKGAYPPEADLASLRRVVALHRDPPRGWVEVADEVRFDSGPGTLESVLTTFAQVEIDQGTVSLRGERGALRVCFDPQTVTPRLETIPDVDLAEGASNVRRVVLALSQLAREGTIRLRIEPV